MAVVNQEQYPLEDRPRLRPVDAFPAKEGGRDLIVLRDPRTPGIPTLTLSAAAVEILRLLSGQRTIQEISSAATRAGLPLTPEQVRRFLEQLDEAGYLEGPRAEARARERRAAFDATPVRVAVHAGGAYPDGLTELPRFLAAGYLDRAGPGSLPVPRDATAPPPPAGLVAPHVDLHRGAPTYSWAYKALAESTPADLYVVLGTCHMGVEGFFAGTWKPYDTPLGAVPTDPSFLDCLGRAWGQDLKTGEFSHAWEHSIEFQAVYLRSLGLAGEGAAPLVAVMCDSLHNVVLPPYSPRDVAIVSDFVAALRQTMATDGRRITVIAAVDFAHVGREFGDDWATDATHMERVRQGDRAMVDLLMQPDPVGYYHQVMHDNDARRICGLTPLYVLAELMAADRRRGELLKYTQWVDPDLSSSVTFASAIFR